MKDLAIPLHLAMQFSISALRFWVGMVGTVSKISTVPASHKVLGWILNSAEV